MVVFYTYSVLAEHCQIYSVNIQSSVLLELSKLATNLVVTCRIYVLSDGEPSVLFGMAWGFREGSHKVPISPPGCLSG